MAVAEALALKAGRKVEILVDDWAENPRDDYEHLGTMWCWHRRYFLGSAAVAAAPAKPQDLIIVLCDDLGYGDLSFIRRVSGLVGRP